MGRRTAAAVFCAAISIFTAFAITPLSAQTITLNGAVQFNDDHAFTKALVKFEELVKKYYGKAINFVLHKNSSLGLEKQYFEYMAQGKAVDYGIVSPAHMSTFSRAAPFIDAPFLFRDLPHWNKVLDADLLKPVADEIFRPVGCLECRNTGYLGRIGIYEILQMTPDVKRFVTEKYDIVPLTQAGYKAGMRPLRVSGVAKVALGVTTFDEVLKAAPLV
jgi:hypothetical protein